jgi:predicted GNAT superfamily acetyltransferase
MDGSAPNLVVVERDAQGRPYYKRSFNTQACEQLNAWLGGFETVLKRMTSANFNWFLHTMLFYHTRHVIQKQEKKNDDTEESDAESDDQ